jgi:hypothetical protein
MAIAFVSAMYPAAVEAAPRPTKLSIVPTITSIAVQNGGLVASGTATALIKGKTTTVPFSGVPVNLALAADQSAATDCPILDLTLGPITLDILGLVVETSPICLNITAHDGEGLLGDLLCAVGNLLNGGLSLDQILGGGSVVDPVTGALIPGLTVTEVNSLLSGIGDLLNGALGNLLDAVITAIDEIDVRQVCSILHLELGPIDLNLLGLEVILDDCSGGPVVVDITAETGRGNLLGNLLCELLGGGALNIGATLQGLLNQLLGLLTS